MADLITGPSGGVTGKKDGGLQADVRFVEKHPDLARRFLTFGKHPRAGHDRARWEGVNWQDYRAQVGVPHREGPWRITVADSTEGTISETVHRWVAEAEGLPWEPGVYTILEHDQRGLVMSDLPGEIAGALPFLGHAAATGRGKLLIAGLGLGIIPAWLLANTAPWRIDVIEIDPDLIRLTTRAARSCAAPGGSWIDSPRLHIHQADAYTWWPGNRSGCALHEMCALWANSTWHAGWMDIWDLVSPHNLPSMNELETRFAPRCGRIFSWERAECEAMLARGQTEEAPDCWIDETGYPLLEEEADDGDGS